ncbi:GRIFN protein, partial [Pachyramphus minor]|nr:GRIFN protein [Pachyramphus minor]
CLQLSWLMTASSTPQLSITFFSHCLRFEINLLCDPGDQIALHFNPRFSSSRIVCNSFLDGHWGKEEVNTTFPFEAKEPFQVEIYSDQDYFHIFINENKVLQYKHRQKNLSSITKLQILNDIDIFSLEITKRGLC